MKKLSRLTALLLALMMMTSMLPVSALATTISMEEYQTLKTRAVDSAAEEEPTVEPVIDMGGEVYDLYSGEENTVTSRYDSETEVSLSAHSAGSESIKPVILPRYGKVTLNSAVAGQWQVQVGNIWVNVVGETGSSFDVTYAKVESLFIANNSAKIRCISADGSQISDVADIGLSYEVNNLVEEEAQPMTMSSRQVNAEAAADEPETEPKTVTVSIFYEYPNGDEVATAYAATIEKGGDFTSSVITLPEVPGYIANAVTPEDEGVVFNAPNGNEAGNIQLVLSDVETDLEYTVKYIATYVDFTVNHFLMGFEGDPKPDPTKDEPYASKVYSNVRKTGEHVGDQLALTIDGYDAIWYDDTTKVAADGSTVINIFYERNWYLMLFELDGGYGVEPIYAQYGAAINIGTPTKAGHVFQGWSSSQGGTVDSNLPPKTMPAVEDGKVTYYAIWKANDTAKVTVVFWGETANCTDENKEYAYIDSGTIDVAVGTSYTYNNESTTLFYICGQEAHTHDSTCVYACGENEHSHTQSCYQYTCTIEEHTHSTSCYTCGQTESHAHSKSCYADVGGASWSGNTNKPSNPSEGQVYKGYLGTYIYISGTWYDYSGSTASGSIAPTTCGKTVHTHSDGCLGCGKIAHTHDHNYASSDCYALTCTETEHTHSSACGYSCGKVAHTHTSSCQKNASGLGLDSNLWEFVSSETVTVAADGSSLVNVKYDRVEKTLTFKYNYKNYGYQSTEEIKAKWGSDISAQYKAIAGRANSTFWSAEQDGSDPYTNYIGIMPDKINNQNYTNYTYYNKGTIGDTGTMMYYGQDLNGEYSIVLFSVPGVGGFNVSDEDRYSFEGFTYDHGSPNHSDCESAKFYYRRNTYTLDFNNGYEVVKSESVLYQASLSTYEDYTPSVPGIYEPGSVEFVGWYLNPEGTGEKYELSEHTMPASNLILYAKWIPVDRTVQVYLTEDDMNAGTNQIGDTVTVPHGSKVPEASIPADPKNGNYTFVGWFYKVTVTNEDGTTTEVEKAFDFKNMPVRRDLKIYAKWNSTQPVGFTVYYCLADENGNPVKDDSGNYIHVAEPTISKALDGDTVTVDAKTGNDLYAAYRDGYFPFPPSHSVEITASSEDPIVYYFWYTPAPNVPYKVVYLQDTDGDGVYETVNETIIVDPNKKVVVTENYKRIPGYMPDSFQKRLILAYPNGTLEDNGNNKTDSELGENIIFFYYHKDTVNALWSTSHFIEPVGGVTAEIGWEQYGITESETGIIGNKYTANPKTIPGFTLSTNLNEVDLVDADGNKTTQATNLTEMLPAGGMDFRLYYTRNEYPIKVQYLDRDTNAKLAEPELYMNATFDYQSQVSVSTDKTFHGYELVSPNPDLLQSVQIDGNTVDTIKKNIITFYYKEKEVTINYVAVGPDGELDPQDSTNTIGYVTSTSETVAVLTGVAAGSTAVLNGNPTYKFVGWFKDEACSTPVDGDWVNGETLVPQQVDTDNVATTAPLYESATYYAKFELDVSTLTISKTVDTLNANTDDPANAAVKEFVFQISNLEKSKEYTYSIRNVDGKKTFTTNPNGVGTITLAAGQTAVIEGIVIGTAVVVSETEYEYYNTTSIPANGTVTIDADGETVAFTNTYTKYKTGSLKLTKQFQDASFTEETKSVTLLLKLKSAPNNPLDPELEKQFKEWALTADGTNKVWNANANEASILITVAASAVNKTNSVTLNNLPVADYVVTEKTDVMPEYNVVYQPEDGCATVTAASTSVPEVKVTNTITGKRDIVVNKIWEDLDNKYGVRPELIQLTLLANGEAATSKAQGFVNPAQVTGTENQWQVTFAGLDTFDTQGNFIVYTVHELAVPEYAVTNTESIVDLTTNELTITNTLQRADLTISKTGLNAFVYKSGGDHESALFKVEATDKTKDDREWTVAINGNSSVTIKGVKIGVQYKVTELNDWTWRYDENASTSKTTEPITEAGASVEFANELDKTQWLNGDNYKVNVFGPSND